MNTMTRLGAMAAGAALVTSALVACGNSDTSGGVAGTDVLSKDLPTQSQINEKIDTSKVKKDLTVGVDNPYYLFSADIVVAEQKGYFKEFGIDKVTIKTIDNPLPALIGGSLDLMNFDTDTTIAAAAKSHSATRFLAVTLGGEANILGVRKGINSAADLKGATITGGQFGSRNDAIMRQLLEQHGVDPDKDVKMVSTGGQSDSRLEAVISGTVDGASLQFRHQRLLEKNGGKFLWVSTAKVPQNGWAADKLIKDSPETAAAFLAAILKARAFIDNQANKDAVLKIMSDAGFEITPDYEAVYKDENAPTYHTIDGGFAPADMDKFFADQVKYKVVDPGTDWKAYTWLLPLWRAQHTLGLPLDPAPDSL